MNIRKYPLANGHYYHVFSRSIAKYTIFNDPQDFSRIKELLKLYRYIDFNYCYSKFSDLNPFLQQKIIQNVQLNSQVLVEIIAYTIMPTHIHLILKQVADQGISKFMSRVLNSYTRYFNSKHHRSGPLWESKFKDVEVSTDNQLLHLTRYFHLNASSAGLVQKPEDWLHSSYLEYLKIDSANLCQFDGLFDFTSEQYRKFVNDRKSYQKQISVIKNMMIDNYSG